jgi:hypothetical protein
MRDNQNQDERAKHIRKIPYPTALPKIAQPLHRTLPNAEKAKMPMRPPIPEVAMSHPIPSDPTARTSSANTGIRKI